VSKQTKTIETQNAQNRPKLANPLAKIGITAALVNRLVITLGVVLILLSLYHVVFAHRIIPGIKIGSVIVGGKTYEQAKRMLEDYENSVDKKVVLKFEDRSFEFKGSDIQLQYNWDASISRAFEVGRTGNIWNDAKDKLAGMVKPIYLPAFYDYDEDLFHARFAQIKGEINIEGKDARYVIAAPGQLDIVDAIEGRNVASDDLFKILINSFDRFSFGAYELPVERSLPSVSKRDIESYQDQVKKIIYNPLVVTYGKKKVIMTPEKMLDLLEFRREENGINIALTSPKLEAFLETISSEVNEPPRGNVVQVDGNRVVKFEITQAGKELDSKKFTREFKTAFISALPSVEATLKDREIPQNTEKFGIFALLGEGNSRFDGSTRARIHNLSLASERMNGVLVPPGGIFSLNNSIGEISGRTGYDTAYIIQNGRTVLGEGGGVCQTSTTLFRAVLNAGLPVVMRYPHAYRVHYYEEDSKPGIDAAIFQPSLDFQFKNDTPNYVVVQTTVDVPNLSMSYKIYGTPDGRSVEMTEPVITNQIAPGAPLMIDDPSLAKGVKIQTDWATWGANVSFMRTIKRSGEVLHTETFSTRYQPWRAVIRVGTKE
jgi:vancomycin resistance protein YoaR